MLCMSGLGGSLLCIALLLACEEMWQATLAYHDVYDITSCNA